MTRPLGTLGFRYSMMAFDSSVGASILKDRWGLASLLASVECAHGDLYMEHHDVGLWHNLELWSGKATYLDSEVS
jgi:hypothetical protein